MKIAVFLLSYIDRLCICVCLIADAATIDHLEYYLWDRDKKTPQILEHRLSHNSATDSRPTIKLIAYLSSTAQIIRVINQN